MRKDTVQFLNLKRINARYKSDFVTLFEEFLEKGHYILGNGVENFENQFAEYCGADYCLGVANGLDALILILRGMIEKGHLKPGDEVIVPANTFIATVLAVSANGLIPVFVDPDPISYNLSRAGVEKAFTSKTKVVLGVHLYGQLCDVEGIEEFCQQRGIHFIEDAAQAHGAVFKNRRAGSFGLAAGFSFYPGKNLGALGDAGAITTSDPELYEVLKSLRNYGSKIKYHHDHKGFNSRLDEIQAMLLSRKLKDLDTENIRRREISKAYRQQITNLKVKLPECKMNEESHVWHLFVVRTKGRDQAAALLKELGVMTLVHYPVIPSEQKAYHEFASVQVPFSKQMQSELLSLPIDPSMSDNEMSQVIQAVNSL